MSDFRWLAYSKAQNGGFCVPCVFFCKNTEGLGRLVTCPLNRFKDALELLRQHGQKTYHTHAVSDLLTFMQIMKNEQASISHQLVSALAEQVQHNRKFLKSVIKTIVFCGKQTLGLRGHRDDQKHLDEAGNHGNFHSLLKFRIEAGDKTLQMLLEKALRNAKYT